MALIGFGCFVGVTLTTGVPDPHYINSGQNSAPDSNIDFPEFEEFVSPAVVEAALSTAGDISDSIGQMVERFQTSWTQDTQKKMTVARNSSASDFRSIDRSLRKR